MQPKAVSVPKELGKPIATPTQVTRVRFSPDGKMLAAACFDGKVRSWDVTGTGPAELPAFGNHNGWVTDIAFAGHTLFSADSWGRLSAWNIAKEAKPLWTVEAAHDGWLRSLALAPDGSRLATCGKDGFVRLWECASGKKVKEFDTKSDMLSLCFADGKTVIAGDVFGRIRRFHWTTSEQSIIIELKELYLLHRIQDVGGVKCLTRAHDGKTLLAGGAEPKTGGFVQAIPLLIALDLATGKRVGQYKGVSDSEGYVTDLACHPDGFVIFTTSGQPGQGKFHFWKPGDAKTRFTGGKQPNCHSVALHPNGDRIAVSATNANSSGNGRVKGKGGEYPQNTSPIQLWKV